MVTPRYGKLSTCSNSTPQQTYVLWGGLFLCEMVTILDLEGINSICQWYCQDSSLHRQIEEGHRVHCWQQCGKVKLLLQRALLMIARCLVSRLHIIKKSNGLRTVPWGTLEVTGHWLDVWPSLTTDYKCCVRNNSSQFRSGPLCPKTMLTVWRNVIVV